jgi:hypothetical protein
VSKLSVESNISENVEAKNKQSSPSIFQILWSVNLNPPEFSRDNETIKIEPKILNVIRKFRGGMIYEVRGQKFILGEYTVGGFPFLAVFSITQKERRGIEDEIFGFPDSVKRQTMIVSAQIVQNIQLSDNLSNAEVDITEHISERLYLPEGWKLTKVVMKVGPNISGSCDICDGTCTHCNGSPMPSIKLSCDSCYCEAIAKEDMIKIKDIETKVLGKGISTRALRGESVFL